MNNNFRFALKVGLGFRPDEKIPTDGLAWAIDQLDLKAYNDSLPQDVVDAHTEILSTSNYDLRERALDLMDLFIEKKKLEETGQSLRNVHDRENALEDADTFRHALNAIYGPNQVNQRLVHFWMNHFTVGSLDFTRHINGDYEREAIAKNLKGSFADMLYDAITHPSMLEYLDNTYNTGPNSQWGKEGSKWGLNDNLGREVLELHTVTPSVGYQESDVRGMAKILTGWGLDYASDNKINRKLLGKGFNGLKDLRKPFISKKSEPGESTVLGQAYSNGKSGLRASLQTLSSHPSTIENCCKKLFKHFVSDIPDKKKINEIIKIWTETNGSLREVHSKVLELAYHNQNLKINWPSTWAYQVTRSHGGLIRLQDRKARDILLDLGMSFWARRQPNGYSLSSYDWVSEEYLDRRLRYVNFSLWNSDEAENALQIARRLGLQGKSLEAIRSTKNPYEQLAILFCSPEFMFA